MGNRWLETSQTRSADEYDRAWEVRAQAGQDIHGEADLVASFEPRSVLDAGCGTGRVAVELARRGVEVVGVDVDARMLAAARRKGPELAWVLGDLAEVEILAPGGERRRFDVVVMAGNVMIFLAPGQEAAVVANMAGHLAGGGLLVAGFQLDGQLDLAAYDELCRRAGLAVAERWSTWDRRPFAAGGGYAVSVHRRP